MKKLILAVATVLALGAGVAATASASNYHFPSNGYAEGGER